MKVWLLVVHTDQYPFIRVHATKERAQQDKEKTEQDLRDWNDFEYAEILEKEVQ